MISARFLTFSFWKMCWTWVSTILTDTISVSAISPFDRPRAMRTAVPTARLVWGPMVARNSFLYSHPGVVIQQRRPLTAWRSDYLSVSKLANTKSAIPRNGGLRLTWEQVIGRRLARHHLLRPAPPARLVGVCSDICGVHAQMAPSAELMLGLRVLGITRQDVRAALWEKRVLVKTVGLRGTLHLLPADEVPLWMAANRLRFESEERRRRRSGIDMDCFFEVVEAISEIVGPEPIGRAELEAELKRRVGGWAVARNEGWVGSYANWPMAVGLGGGARQGRLWALAGRPLDLRPSRRLERVARGGPARGRAVGAQALPSRLRAVDAGRVRALVRAGAGAGQTALRGSGGRVGDRRCRGRATAAAVGRR